MLLFLAFLAFLQPLSAQTIAEKKASLNQVSGDLTKDSESFLYEVNRELLEGQQTLAELYKEAEILYKSGADEEAYRCLLQDINDVRQNLADLENSWRLSSLESDNTEPYALWHQPDTSIGQLIIDYGSQDYVYLMPKEISEMKLSIGSNLPIPRSAWNQMLTEILTQNGVGIRELNPFLKELFLVKTDRSGIKLITNKRADLGPLPPNTRLAFVLSPDPSEVRRTYFFLDNFVNHASTIVQLVGRDILIIGEAQAIEDLLKLSDFVGQTRGEIEWRAVSLTRTSPDEMVKILGAVFNPTQEREKSFVIKDGKRSDLPSSPPDANGLKVIKLSPPASGLFLVGTREEIRKAEGVIRDVEGQIGSAREKTIYWYTAKHSDPDELADVLSKIYALMIKTGTGMGKGPQDLLAMANQLSLNDDARPNEINIIDENPLLADYFPQDNYFDSGVPITTTPVRAAESKGKKPTSNRTNFIVDQKTSAIVMVVEADILANLKDLIRKLDVPKKMVQLEVLLFEKKSNRVNEFGLNLLRLGSCAKNVDKTCALFKEVAGLATPLGIFDFLVSRKQNHSMPAFDLIYRFLLSQHDVTINSNPSVVTINQTPAYIAIQEEQSIDTGTYQLDEANITALASFKRAQFGIAISITPTIHMRDPEDQEPFNSITLESDITFDTVRSNEDSRPVVVRRKIKNEARVADGETIILGGLRRKDTDDAQDGIPFLGEIPGLGKLFSWNQVNDSTTEMFIFITPKIIIDPSCELETIRQEEMCRRPGDLPEFMCCLVQAIKEEKDRLFTHALTMLFGREDDRLYSPDWHNDDTCRYPDGRPPCFIGEYDGR